MLIRGSRTLPKLFFSFSWTQKFQNRNDIRYILFPYFLNVPAPDLPPNYTDRKCQYLE